MAMTRNVGALASARSRNLLESLESGLDRMMMGWLLAAGLACAARIAASPASAAPGAATILPFLLLILVPFGAMVLALRWFAEADSEPQPAFRLAAVGRWRSIPRNEALRDPLYGPGGLMVSLLVGILLNVPLRAAEYLAAMPALSGGVPGWLASLHLAMTVDVLLFTGLYTVAFVAALKRLPLFPRLLAAIWLVDIAMQLGIARAVAAAPGVPADVAAALQALLWGNVQKVLISAAVWLPYLALSKRVNVTYRHRVRAS